MEVGSHPKFILDTDSGNEIDDLYALAYLYPAEEIELLGITSAQWFHHLSGDSTVYESQRLNEEITALAGRSELPLPRGADMIMGKPWGGYTPSDSPAARFMIDAVKQLADGEKLVIMGIGAATNIASAIALDSTIVPHIVVYILGHRYDFDGGFWNKDEFNIQRDLNAANFLLNQRGLELHVMPISTAKKYRWDRKETFELLDEGGAMGAYLKAAWLRRFPEADSWVMWDGALLQAFLHPAQASQITVMTPPENTARRVFVYNDIDEAAMWADFKERIRKFGK